jgi:hypothetical protein
LWFSENFSTAKGEDFSGDADITLTAVHLDGSAPTVVQEGGVPSFNRDIKNFSSLASGPQSPDAGKSPPATKESSSHTCFKSRNEPRLRVLGGQKERIGRSNVFDDHRGGSLAGEADSLAAGVADSKTPGSLLSSRRPRQAGSSRGTTLVHRSLTGS